MIPERIKLPPCNLHLRFNARICCLWRIVIRIKTVVALTRFILQRRISRRFLRAQIKWVVVGWLHQSVRMRGCFIHHWDTNYTDILSFWVSAPSTGWETTNMAAQLSTFLSPVYMETRLLFHWSRWDATQIYFRSQLVWKVNYSAVLHIRGHWSTLGALASLWNEQNFFFPLPILLPGFTDQTQHREMFGIKSTETCESADTFGDEAMAVIRALNIADIRQLPEAACWRFFNGSPWACRQREGAAIYVLTLTPLFSLLRPPACSGAPHGRWDLLLLRNGSVASSRSSLWTCRITQTPEGDCAPAHFTVQHVAQTVGIILSWIFISDAHWSLFLGW